MRNIKTFALAVLCLLASVRFAQGAEPSSGVFPLPLKEYLEMSDAQVREIVRVNSDYRDFIAAKEARINQLQTEITMATGRESPDPMTLGVRYAEIEAIRRERAEETTRHRDKLRQMLNEAQRAKLRALEEAARLQPLIGAAQCENFLPAPADSPCSPTAPARRIAPHMLPGEQAPLM